MNLTAKRLRIIKADGPGASQITFEEWHELCELALRGYVSPSSPGEAVQQPWDKVERRKDNWTLIVKEYEPKINFMYKDDRGVRYTFFGLVHAEDDYYYGLMDCDTGRVRLATCVGGLEQMYEQIPNGGRCGQCNVVYPASGPEKCERYRCPQGPNPLSDTNSEPSLSTRPQE